MATAAGLGEAARYCVALNWGPMLGVVHNEQTKLTATALNNIAVAFVIAGFIGPLVAYGFGSTTLPPTLPTAVISLSWFLTGLILHLIARLILLRLIP
jgi:hypothetical protein